MKKKMTVSLIAVKDPTSLIGRANGKLPWIPGAKGDIPADMAWFRKKTLHKVIIMGRVTFESIGRALPDRTNIVISKNTEFKAEGCIVVHSAEEALEKARELKSLEVVIIGGAKIYRLFADLVDCLYITNVQHRFEPLDGDVFFPITDLNKWDIKDHDHRQTDERNKWPLDFVKYERAA